MTATATANGDETEAKAWLERVAPSHSDDDGTFVAVYVAEQETLQNQARTKLCILLIPPMFLLAPFFIVNVNRLVSAAPKIRYVVSQKGIGTYLSQQTDSSSSSSSSSSTSMEGGTKRQQQKQKPISNILDYNLVSNRIGFIRWREILRVDVLHQNKNLYTLTFTLKEVERSGDYGAKNVRLDWAVEDPFSVKAVIDQWMDRAG